MQQYYKILGHITTVLMNIIISLNGRCLLSNLTAAAFCHMWIILSHIVDKNRTEIEFLKCGFVLWCIFLTYWWDSWTTNKCFPIINLHNMGGSWFIVWSLPCLCFLVNFFYTNVSLTLSTCRPGRNIIL